MLSLQMAAIVNALDNYSKIQYGENGHIEYGWSNNIREKITQFSFQLTRTNNDWQLNNLKNILTELLTTLKQNLFSSNTRMREEAKGLLSVLYKMIGHTRDIIDGKGECLLTYMMILTWYGLFPELAHFAIRCLVEVNHGDNIPIHQYGSWKDIKYFCEYCKNQTNDQEHPLIQYSVDLTNKQLAHDFLEYKSGTVDISLAAKWIPREKSSFGWLYEQLAMHFFSAYLQTATTSNVKAKAVLKCKTDYRKILSTLNRHLDTLQIKQCDQVWSEIDFKKVTSISLSKQKKAFLNIKKDGQVRHPDNFDRIECAEHFNAHIQKAVRGETEMKGKRVGMADFTEQALELIRTRNQPEIDLLNSQWRDNSTQTGALGKFIAMVDVSGSMSGDPMNVAIALGIRIAEKSLLGKRVMTFSSKPTWVNLEKYDDFVSQVDIVSRAEWGMNTNFHSALETILDAIIENKMAPEDVQDMVLVILSDMQMDSADRSAKQESLYKTMEKKYADAGVRVHGQPYKPPHILFWNLRSTSGFPTLSNQSNASMMSGFSPALLNLFCEQGLEALQSCSPWSLLERSLANPRYKIMGDKIEQEFDV
jgi:hypothetical protein